MQPTIDQPRWASPPGDSITPLLTERGLTLEDLADHTELSDPDARRLLAGELTVSPQLADALHRLLGGAPEFWLNRFSQYTESLHWVRADQLAQALPVPQLIEFGWLQHAPDWVTTAQHVLQYFDVADADEWRQRWGSTLTAAHYRASASFEQDELAVAAWLRQIELRAAEQPIVHTYDAAAFRSALDRIRALTRDHDPQRFIPRLQALTSAAGVCVVVERAPQGCTLSGAAFRAAGRPTIGLTARHLNDEHFWFTFFHEAGHVLDGLEETPVLDDLDEVVTSGDEQQANDFARDLILQGNLPVSLAHRSARQVLQQASRLGIAPGLLVGQLQHAGVTSPANLNGVKRWYRWEGITLLPKR
jgi:plasmid maintenance system antidote protein VapI